jgi:hypothetical protein
MQIAVKGPAGAKRITPVTAAEERTRRNLAAGVLLEERENAERFASDLVWRALLRKLDRENPGYDA